ncbi:phage major capsid protein [Actinomyces sp. 432]|uniref:hypothetical protein n=1 Tax=Actinomyces sp. 432 TaxID=2057798 RepID=UPI0013746692|nr:hypothetical protein [Actinomyces sp. 432]QHO91929.1 phage major capsid protein [Actinomyces sp. 432]
MATLTEAREAAVKAALDAQNIMTSAGADVTDEQIKAVEDAVAEVKALDARIAGAKDAKAALAAIAKTNDADAVDDYEPGEDTRTKARDLGDRYIRSDAYQAFRKANPAGLGEGTPLSMPRVKIGDMADFLANRKADGAVLGTPISHPTVDRYPTVDMVDRRPLTLLDVIGRGRMSGPFDYVQITGVTNNAAIVEEATSADDGLKPTSDMTTTLADARPYTFADGFVVTNQLLSDAPRSPPTCRPAWRTTWTL